MTFQHVPRVGGLSEPSLPDVRPASPQPAPAAFAAEAFDYGALDVGVADRVRGLADRIRRAQSKAAKEVGQCLMEAKEVVGHGGFEAWLASEFAMTSRTAMNYMAAARFLADKSETISFLPPSAIYALAAPSADERVVLAVVSEVDQGRTFSASDIRERLNAAVREREAAEAPEKAQHLKELEKRRRAREEKRREEMQAEQAAETARRRTAAAETAALIYRTMEVHDIASLLKLMRRTDWYIVQAFFLSERQVGNAVDDATGESVARCYEMRAAGAAP